MQPSAPLDVEDLSTTLFTRRGEMKAVDGLSLSVGAGETVALVGESGCGKSLSALSHHAPAARSAGPHRRRRGPARTAATSCRLPEEPCSTSAARRSA